MELLIEILLFSDDGWMDGFTPKISCLCHTFLVENVSPFNIPLAGPFW